ncbi:hypothetical protein CSKR_113807 [Clonorchis sinensis]|uniref:Uncharacterized protein n=1 Tax=Clonorchis sinensis TaxID=79923 RepID=A0A419PWM6_CLOSI|nr:hypothetical protein CSKR_113807 [Clonorchis sinensis]
MPPTPSKLLAEAANQWAFSTTKRFSCRSMTAVSGSHRYSKLCDKHGHVPYRIRNLLMSGFPLVFIWILFGIDLCFNYQILYHVSGASKINRRLSDHRLGTFDTRDESRSSYLTHQNTSTPCPVFCFLRPPDNQMVACVRHPSEIRKEEKKEIKFIECRQYKGKGEIILGNRESVRGIETGALSKLLNPGEELPTSAGQLSIYLNLNMVRLEAGAFQGLETVITEVRLINTVQMHPDSLLALKHLRAFEIESGRTPVFWIGESETNGTETDRQTLRNMPMYIRLQPVDPDAPISFNLETRCHQCVEVNSTEATHLIVVLQSPQTLSMRENRGRPVGFSILFPQTCPKLSEAPGCSRFWDDYDYSTLTSTTAGRPNHRNTEGAAVQHTAYDPSLLILLSVWCTLLTIVILLIVGIVYWCTRRLHHQKPLPRWLPIICATQQSSIEDVSINSSNSDISKPPGSSLRVASGTLFNSLLNGSRGSWNSLRGGGLHSRSAHSLKDRNVRANRYYQTIQNQRTRRAEPRLRSIGSQTDFNQLSAETALYSSLRRHQLPSEYSVYPEPPFRTSSHYALSRMQYLTKFDSVYPKVEPMRNRYSFGGASIMDTIENGPYLQNFSSPTEPSADIPEASKHFSMDYELLMHPPVHTLPPIHPVSQKLNDSPAPWKRSLQNGSLRS